MKQFDAVADSVIPALTPAPESLAPHAPNGAPSRVFHAEEIWTSCGLASKVRVTEASILARKQFGSVHDVESGQIASLPCWPLAAARIACAALHLSSTLANDDAPLSGFPAILYLDI
jgi:hypothetical protein